MIESIADLASRIDSPELDRVRELFDIQTIAASPLLMSAAGWAIASETMGLPRAEVEHQAISTIRDRFTGHEAIVNPVRARRMGGGRAMPAGAVSPDPADAHCRWCHEWDVRQSGLWVDEWGPVSSPDGRIGTRPNWARQSPVNGLAFGDQRMHHLDALTESEFAGLFEVGERYLQEARRALPEACFAMLFLNGGPKSASSVEHAHLQIAARADRHFAYPELIAARCPGDYWQRQSAAHEQAGLSIVGGSCTGWVALAPVKERDFIALSANVTDGARFVYRIWRDLARAGTRNFSLAAILSPGLVGGQAGPQRFVQWPHVVWRFVDRGDPEVAHGDIGSMELFGSTVTGSDPFAVARLLQG